RAAKPPTAVREGSISARLVISELQAARSRRFGGGRSFPAVSAPVAGSRRVRSDRPAGVEIAGAVGRAAAQMIVCDVIVEILGGEDVGRHRKGPSAGFGIAASIGGGQGEEMAAADTGPLFCKVQKQSLAAAGGPRL